MSKTARRPTPLPKICVPVGVDELRECIRILRNGTKGGVIDCIAHLAEAHVAVAAKLSRILSRHRVLEDESIIDQSGKPRK
jgi:hypothetical protein